MSVYLFTSCMLLSYSETEGKVKAQQLLTKIFETIKALNPSKNATDYWLAINKTILAFTKKDRASLEH